MIREGGRLVFRHRAPGIDRLRQSIGCTASLFLLLVVFVQIGSPRDASGIVATVTAIAGKATVKKTGVEQPVQVSDGDDVGIGEDIVTAADSAVQVTFADSAFLNLFPGSGLRINHYSYDPVSGRRSTWVKVLRGKARFVLYKIAGPGSTFQVETPDAAVAPDMLADFAVSVTESGTEVVALGKPLLVKNNSALIVGELRLDENERTIVRKATRPADSTPLSRNERKLLMQSIYFFRRN